MVIEFKRLVAELCGAYCRVRKATAEEALLAMLGEHPGELTDIQAIDVIAEVHNRVSDILSDNY